MQRTRVRGKTITGFIKCIQKRMSSLIMKNGRIKDKNKIQKNYGSTTVPAASRRQELEAHSSKSSNSSSSIKAKRIRTHVRPIRVLAGSMVAFHGEQGRLVLVPSPSRNLCNPSVGSEVCSTQKAAIGWNAGTVGVNVYPHHSLAGAGLTLTS